MKFSDLRLSYKLWSVILGLLIAMLAVSLWAQFSANRAVDAAMASVNAFEQKITTAVRWRGATETAVTMVLGGAVTTDPVLAQSYDAQVKDIIGRINVIQSEVVKSAVSSEDKQALENVASARSIVLGLTAKTKDVKAAGDAAAMQSFVDGTYKPAIAKYIAALDNFVTVQERQRDAAKAEADASRHQTATVAMVSVAVVFALGVLLTLVLVRSITRPLGEAVGLAQAITSGDLTQQLQSERKDEFGQLLRAMSEMVAKLRQLVAEVRSGVESVSTASVEIANGNQDLSSRTEQTAANLQETAASMEQLTSTVTQSADTARQATQLAVTAAQTATRGGEVVGQVVHSMQNISEASRKIGDIIGTIDGIAFQTNILALNAAVEAARAGEQGRGFAVVASEVRSLAQRSAQAAKEIKDLISASGQTVEAGTQQVAQAGETMGEIVSSVRRVSDLIGEISASSTEQRDGIGQVNLAVTNLDQMTQQNAALVEQSAAAAAGLRDQAQRLSEVVAVFNVGAGAGLAPRAAAHAPVAAAVRTPAARPVPVKHHAPATPRPAALKPKAVASAPRKLGLATPAAPAAKPAAASGGEGDWENF
ncbi:methyl-accepting chemotaxis protein [Variovorax sp. HJSM1_2]|uniref:methyl-accepting chemotaxis protein n=1 Tax=Variovorax sp. HJSM1_2 TaxID=3366263 RepID=UPI003BD8B39F